MQNTTQMKPFSFYAGKSFSIHAVICVLAIIFSAWKWSEGKKQRKENIKLVQASVRVDVVAMPKRTFKELKALQSASAPVETQKAAPKVAQPTPDTGKEFLKKKKKLSFSDLMKQYSKKKVEDARPKRRAQKAKKGLAKKDLARLQGLIKRGNKVSKGTALVGGSGTGDVTVLNEYALKLPERVKPFWKLPSYLANKSYRCQIQLFINSQGKIVRAKVFEKSENPEYDQRALDAVLKTGSFSAPPKSVASMTVKGGILLAFPL